MTNFVTKFKTSSPIHSLLCERHKCMVGDIQLLCYHKVTTIWTPLPLVCTFTILKTPLLRTFKTLHQPPPTPYKNSKLCDFIIS